MAFHVGNQAAIGQTALAGQCSAQVTFRISGDRLPVGLVHIAPQQHAIVGQHLLFFVHRQVLQNHVGAGIHAPNLVGHAGEQVDARLVVAAPRSHVIGVLAFVLRKTFGQIKAEAIELVLGEPVAVHVVDVALGVGAFVVEIVAHVEGVRGHRIEPRAVFGGALVRFVPVHPHQRTLPEVVVEHHVQQHHEALGVGFVDKFFQVFLRTVVLIGRQCVRRVVAPAFVALELHDRHQLNSVHAQAFQVA